MMANAEAWILPLFNARRAAVGALELVHVLTGEPARTDNPDAPEHLRQAFRWEDQVVPIFDVNQFIEPGRAAAGARLYGIVRYRPRPGAPQAFGALPLADVPRRVRVSDDQACDLPAPRARWRSMAQACFALDGTPVPVLDLVHVFSGVLSGESPPASGPDTTVYTDSLATT